MPDRPPWNHNIHYHPLILAALPPGSQRALDVGCGDGLLARRIRERVPHVSAIDRDAPVLGRARREDSGAGVEYLQGDFLSYGFQPGSFDVVVSVAALHHMDPSAALTRMRDLLRPGGVLAVVGLARSSLPADLPRELAAAAAVVLLNTRHRHWGERKARMARGEVLPPVVWPPPHSYREIRRLAAELLPGVRYWRHLLWRYSLVWVKPSRQAASAPAWQPTGPCARAPAGPVTPGFDAPFSPLGRIRPA